ncbi:hypothetical protein [Bremerella cremea]|uniref:hypothetical protein n=1 Tax=Bremerella cremea TaxID=1031537 RepID=UPI0018F38597|nr:hypothetical protein [Bremerella cremea]
MDQLKPIFAGLKKYYFWVCAGIITLVAIGGWYMATSGVDKQTEAKVQEIKSSLNTASTIASTQNHPNAAYETGMKQWLTKYREDIEQAWKEKWNAQRKLLKWPAELGKGFEDEVNGILLDPTTGGRRPIEALTEEDMKELRVRTRELYRDYIKEELPKLADIIGAHWQPTGGAGGGGGGGYGLGGDSFGGEDSFGGFAATGGTNSEYGGPGGGGANPNEPPKKAPLVIWSSTNQGAIQAKSFDWSGAASKNTPTTKEVLYAQENLWVLENLMRIIKKTNGDISSPHQATIKQIISIEFGRDVMPIRSRVSVPRLATGMGEGGEYGSGGEGGYMEDSSMMDAGGYGGEDPSMMMDGGYGGEGGMMGEGGATMATPGEYRYVDKDYKKLTLEEVQAASTAPTSENYYLTVAKRLPIRMRLVMDQREIDKLLVECGNADMMVEVRQVRVNATDSNNGGAGGYGGGGGGYEGGGGMSGVGGGYADDFGGGMAGGGMSGESGPGGANNEQNEKLFEVPVEIYGIIYIYNPVNKALLWPDGAQTADEEAVTESASLMPPADRR